MLKYKGFANGLSQWMGQALSMLPISPNQWTALSVASAFAGAYFAFQKNILAFAAFIALSFACDFFDGAVARQRKAVSKKGAFLDGVSDRLVEAAYILGISFFALPDFFVPAQLWLFTMLVFGTFMTSFVKAYSEHTGVLSHKQAHGIAGLLERGERVGLLLCALVALPFSALASSAIIALVAVLCFVTFLQRVAIVMES